MMVAETATAATIMAALSTLSPSQLSDLNHSILTLTHRHQSRLSSVLSSPALFSLTIAYLHTLSFSQKTLLIARHLLSSLHHLTCYLQSRRDTLPSPPLPFYATIRQRDCDAVLMLLLLCETHQHNPEALELPYSEWRVSLSKIYCDSMLSLSSSGINGVCNGASLIPYIEMVARCRRFVGAMDCGSNDGEEREVAASVAAVVGLPAVEVKMGGKECVICKEEMKEGRDVCELPCQHLFHWGCILPWLKKRNTCPCCRFRMPSDDVLGEIQRLWEALVKKAK